MLVTAEQLCNNSKKIQEMVPLQAVYLVDAQWYPWISHDIFGISPLNKRARSGCTASLSPSLFADNVWAMLIFMLNVSPLYGCAALCVFDRKFPNASCGLDLSRRSSCLIKQTKPELQLFRSHLALPLYPGRLH